MALAHVRRGSGPPLVPHPRHRLAVADVAAGARPRERASARSWRSTCPASATPRSTARGRRSRRWRARWPSSSTGSGSGGAHVGGQLAGRRRRARDGPAGRGALGLPALPRRLHQRPRGRLRARRARWSRAASRSSATAHAELLLRRPGAAHARVLGTSPPGRGGSPPTRPRARCATSPAAPASRPPSRRSRTSAGPAPEPSCPVTVAWGDKDRAPALLAPERPRAAAAARTRGTSRSPAAATCRPGTTRSRSRACCSRRRRSSPKLGPTICQSAVARVRRHAASAPSSPTPTRSPAA